MLCFGGGWCDAFLCFYFVFLLLLLLERRRRNLVDSPRDSPLQARRPHHLAVPAISLQVNLQINRLVPHQENRHLNRQVGRAVNHLIPHPHSHLPVPVSSHLPVPVSSLLEYHRPNRLIILVANPRIPHPRNRVPGRLVNRLANLQCNRLEGPLVNLLRSPSVVRQVVRLLFQLLIPLGNIFL